MLAIDALSGYLSLDGKVRSTLTDARVAVEARTGILIDGDCQDRFRSFCQVRFQPGKTTGYVEFFEGPLPG